MQGVVGIGVCSLQNIDMDVGPCGDNPVTGGACFIRSLLRKQSWLFNVKVSPEWKAHVIFHVLLAVNSSCVIQSCTSQLFPYQCGLKWR